MSQEYMSISRIQRECAVGFPRAGKIFVRLVKEGILEEKPSNNKGCKVLVQDKFGLDSQVTSSEQSYFKED